MLKIILIISWAFSFFIIAAQSSAGSPNFKLNQNQRKYISVVGSSTVYPFMAIIAETFGRDTKFKTPIIESTGTGGGFKTFCAGVGYDFPDFVNASRPIKPSEAAKCKQNLVTFKEIKIGYDGIVLANSTRGLKFDLTKEQIFLALSAQVPNQNGELVANFYKNWHEIDTKLPNLPIIFYGPPATSGTRDAFVELVLIDVCQKNKSYKNTFKNDDELHKKCQLIRQDGIFIEAGENDNLVVQKLKNNINALGIFGFSFLKENKASIQPSMINSITPSLQNIVNGEYKISRPLFTYFKTNHLSLVEGMLEFVDEIISTHTIGMEGYLMQSGLIPLSTQEIERIGGELRKDL